MTAVTMDKIVNLCKRRGFVFPASEIYGGLGRAAGTTVRSASSSSATSRTRGGASMVTARDDIVGLDRAILMHPRVWEASGHVAGFTDPLVDCKECKQRFRADHVQRPERCPETAAASSPRRASST